MPLTEAELLRFACFRRAAEQVREASIIDQGHTIDVLVHPGEPGFMDVFVKLLNEEAFRSLAASVRLIYMQSEPAHFSTICNLLCRENGEDIRNRVALIRRQWVDALQDKGHTLGTFGADGSPVAFTPQQMLEHWLYGIVFHQDPDRQEALRILSTDEHLFRWNVQATALQLAGRILDLDDVIADVLAEARVPRIGEC